MTPSVPRKLSKTVERLANALLVAASLVVTLLAAEVGVRILSPESSRIAPTSDQYKFYAFDPRLGWVNKAGAEGEFRRPEFSYPVHINRQGMRDRDTPAEPSSSATRVAVLGDSFTWGIGVADADRFTDVVERASGGRYEMLNFGVAGYGPVQYDLQLDDVFRFKPDVVLISFCLGNDFADNVFWKRYGYYKPYVDEITPGALTLKGYPLPKVGQFLASRRGAVGWLIDRSRLARLVLGPLSQRRLMGLGSPQAGLTDFDETQRDLYSASETPRKVHAKATAIAVNRQILSAIKAKLDAQHVPFAIVVSPSKCEYGLCFGEGKPNWAARDALLDTLKALGIPAIDGSGTIGPEDFWQRDGHWKASGHMKIAAGVLPWLDTHPAPRRNSTAQPVAD